MSADQGVAGMPPYIVRSRLGLHHGTIDISILVIIPHGQVRRTYHQNEGCGDPPAGGS
jgi:hypothetical protein